MSSPTGIMIVCGTSTIMITPAGIMLTSGQNGISISSAGIVIQGLPNVQINPLG
jgi:hypothetical protein